jgi:hypothetical protein
VIKVEGLHSYKAIAFIPSKSYPKNKLLKTETYYILRTSLQKIAFFSRTSLFSFRNMIRNSFNEKLVDEKWKK